MAVSQFPISRLRELARREKSARPGSPAAGSRALPRDFPRCQARLAGEARLGLPAGPSACGQTRPSTRSRLLTPGAPGPGLAVAEGVAVRPGLATPAGGRGRRLPPSPRSQRSLPLGRWRLLHGGRGQKEGRGGRWRPEGGKEPGHRPAERREPLGETPGTRTNFPVTPRRIPLPFGSAAPPGPGRPAPRPPAAGSRPGRVGGASRGPGLVGGARPWWGGRGRGRRDARASALGVGKTRWDWRSWRLRPS